MRSLNPEAEKQSGRHVRHELHFQQGDIVFQLQLALLEAAQLKLIVMTVQGQHFNDCIQVAVLDVELNDAALNFFFVDHRWKVTITINVCLQFRMDNRLYLQQNCSQVHSLTQVVNGKKLSSPYEHV